MNKAEFLAALRLELGNVTTDERDAALDYYSEYFADAGEENEQSVLSELGSPALVAENIRQNCGTVPAPIRPAQDYRKNQGTQGGKAPHNNSRTILIILLAVVTFPLWIGIAGGLFGLIVGVLATLFALCAAGVALIIAGVGLTISGIILLGTTIASGITMMGGGLIVASIGLLITAGMVFVIGKGVPLIGRGIGGIFKALFGKGGSV
ncbi:MAG: DUF1700 domain-containing protein [Oscillospiraceae bacterium]